MLLADLLALGGAGVHHVAEFDVFLARALQHRGLHLVGQRLKRLVDVKFVVFGQALQQGKVVAIAPVPALDGAAGQT